MLTLFVDTVTFTDTLYLSFNPLQKPFLYNWETCDCESTRTRRLLPKTSQKPGLLFISRRRGEDHIFAKCSPVLYTP